MPIVHESYPAPINHWDLANVKLKDLQRLTGPSLLEHPLPDPSIFITPQSTLKPALILMWLRLRPILLWRMSFPDPKLFSNREWRAMLEAADGFKISSNPLRGKMLAELRTLLESSHSTGVILNMENLTSAPALWNGINITSPSALDPNIIREIVWELYEAKFRIELLMLDKHLVPEPVGESDEAELMREIWYEWDIQVHHCWPGLAYRPLYAHPGLSSSRAQSLRISYLKGLFDLVQGWPGDKAPELQKPFPSEDNQLAVSEVEEVLANYYVRIFLNSFHRPATIPHVAL